MKTIAFLLAVGCGVAALMLLSWPGRAQEQAGALSPAGIDAAWEAAKSQEAAGQYQAALQQYQAIGAQASKWKQREKAAVFAGRCLMSLSRPLEAVTAYDQAIAVEEQRNRTGRGEVSEWMQVALHGKALAGEQLGNRNQALQAIERLRAEFPKSPYTLRAAEIKARLEGRAVEAAVAGEKAALQLAEELSEFVQRDQRQTALERCDLILNQYADTAAVFPALRSKALVLWRQHKYPEARAVYQQIVDRVRPVAPLSTLVRTAEYRMAWLDSTELSKRLISNRSRGRSVQPDQWQRLHDLAGEVIAKDPNPVEQAMARLMIIESLCWQNRDQESLEAALRFLEEHDREKKLNKFRSEIGWAHLYAGIALQRLKRFDEALVHFRWIVQPPVGQRENWLGDHVVPYAYFRIWYVLYQAGVGQNELRRAAEDFLSRFPTASDARHVRSLTPAQTRPATFGQQ